MIHDLPSESKAAIATLYGDSPQPPTSLAQANPQARMDQAVIQASRQLKQQLGPAADDATLARALDLVLVLGHAVSLHLDGTASVQHGDGAYTTHQGACSCPEAEEQQAPCQHVLAVEMHRRAQALLQGSQPGPATPGQPTASANWDVHEAQVSCSLKIQLGRGEIIFTMRATTDEEVEERLRKRLTFIQELEEEIARRQASQAEPPAPAEPPAQSEPSADAAPLEQMVEDAIQRAMQAWAAAQTHASGMGQAAASPPAEEPPSDADRYNERGDKWCKGHRVWMKLRSNEGGKWHSHWIAAENRWCRGD